MTELNTIVKLLEAISSQMTALFILGVAIFIMTLVLAVRQK